MARHGPFTDRLVPVRIAFAAWPALWPSSPLRSLGKQAAGYMIPKHHHSSLALSLLEGMGISQQDERLVKRLVERLLKVF